ncbi:hypothetical protein AKJ09_02458 [Labilithrix luteola]|uniref:Uncharacterized protein n=2 Tax=Labilithrix luteola TaxID=1391654 RepID=A0A0K1PRP8_9BACT|nr:hypothetical protein AKJ09_02458 [Labilithrix luteola]
MCGSALAHYMVVEYTRHAVRGRHFGVERVTRATHLTDRLGDLVMNSIDTRSLAAHVIRLLGVAQAKGRVARLDEVASELDVRRTDVRAVVSRLHAEGHVDALRMKLTMSGLGIAAALSGSKLRTPRRHEEAVARVA